MNLRDQILKAVDQTNTAFEVEEWGTTIYLKTMNVKDRLEFKKYTEENDTPSSAYFIAMLTVDENGNQVFTEDDIEALEQKNAVLMDKIVMKALEVNGLTDSDEDEDQDEFDVSQYDHDESDEIDLGKSLADN